jgi:hypothetical protein
VSQSQQDPAWQEVSLNAPHIDIGKLKSSAQNQGISPSTISSVLNLIKQTGGGLSNAQSGFYSAAGSSTPVYGESGYPSAIPVSGYAGGGEITGPNTIPAGKFLDASGNLQSVDVIPNSGLPATPTGQLYSSGIQSGEVPSIEINAGQGNQPFTSGAQMYQQMISDYLAQNPNDAAAAATAAALQKNIPTGTGWRARQFYGIGPSGGGNGPVGQSIGSGSFQGESGPTSFGTNTSGLFGGLEPAGSLGGGLASGGGGGMLPGSFTVGFGGGGGSVKPSVKYL